MKVKDFLEKLKEFGGRRAIAVGDRSTSYDQIHTMSKDWLRGLRERGVPEGATVALIGDYGPESVAALFAFMENNNIVVPVTPDSASQEDMFIRVAEVEWRVELSGADVNISETGNASAHSLYGELRKQGHPGLVLFSSGSTGEPKAALHDICRILKRYNKLGKAFRTLVFLQMDHIGGINTLFYTLANGGMIVIPASRSPEEVARAIEFHKVELLPTSPTFLNLLLLSGAYQRYAMDSLKLITYGTEPMPASTLERLSEVLPHVRLKQTYGLSETGIMKSKSRDDSTTWMKIGGEGFETKIVNGRLWIKSEAAMLGYLNRPSPFDKDGFFDTGDIVVQDGEWIKVLCRESEIINVGGNKVFPTEIENVISSMEEVEDVLIYGEPNPLTGNSITAIIKPSGEIALNDLKTRVRIYCRDRLEKFKIPTRIKLAQGDLHSARFKKARQLRN